MKTYNFEKFTNSRGQEMLNVLSEGYMPISTQDLVNNSASLAKKLFTCEVIEISELSKEEFIEDYILGEASIKGEEAENLYNQILNFK